MAKRPETINLNTPGTSKPIWYVRSDHSAWIGPFFSAAEAQTWTKRNGGEIVERDGFMPTISIAELARRNGVHK